MIVVSLIFLAFALWGLVCADEWGRSNNPAAEDFWSCMTKGFFLSLGLFLASCINGCL